MTFGEKLQLLRKSKNMSQEQLAALIPVSRQAVSKWELGESLPDIDNVVQLSKLFGVSIDYLLKDEFQINDNIPTLKENNLLLKKNYYNKTLHIVGIVISSISAFGILILWILSTMIEVHVTKSGIRPDGTIVYYGGGDVLGYDFWTFISEYRLMAIFWVLLVLLIIGIILILIKFGKYGGKDRYNFKIIWFILSISTAIAIVSLFISKYKNTSQVFILPAYIVLVAVFSSSIKTGSYEIIAGYDRNINYSKKSLNKILYNITFLSILDLMIYQILNLVLILINGPIIIYKILLYVIIINFFSNIFIINFKYREELVPNKEEREKLIKESKPQNIFLIKFLFTIVIFFLMFQISNTENNTVEALKFIGLLTPNIILLLIMILRREYNKSEYLFKSDKIMILLSFILDILTIVYSLSIR